jgi:non-ribosomal peptide synthetase component F
MGISSSFVSSSIGVGFRPAIAKAILNQLSAVFASFAVRPRQPLGSVDWVGDDGTRKILVDWNRTERCYPREPTFRGLFEVRAAERPNATALVFASDTMSYGELDARPNQVAYALLRRGIGPETPVVLLMKRSSEMVISILGILKASGGYVRFGPSVGNGWPPQWGARVVITQPHLLRASEDVAADVVVIQRHDPLEAAANVNPVRS